LADRCNAVMKRGILGGVLLTLFDANGARAESASPAVHKLELEWSAPDECATRASVLSEIERIAARPIERDFRARVIVTRGASSEYRAHITMRVGTAFDERDVEGATCAEIADASALLIALALAPEARSVAPPPERAEPSADVKPSADVSRPVPRHMILHLGVMLGVDAFALPRPVPSVRPTLGISSDHLLLGIEGFVSPSVRDTVSGEPYKGASFRLLGAKVAGCWVFRASRLRMGPCIGLGMMGIESHGFGVTQTRSSITWTPSLAGEGRIAWAPVPRFEAVLNLGVGVPTEQLAFSVASASGAQRIHRVEPVTLTVGIGIARTWDVLF
jgi:hypothetical protein